MIYKTIKVGVTASVFFASIIFLGTIINAFVYDKDIIKQRVNIFLPEGFCDGFTVFYEEDEVKGVSDNAIRVGDNPGSTINIFRWNGEAGVLIHITNEDISLGYSFYYFNENKESAGLAQYGLIRDYGSASDFKIGPFKDNCIDNITWEQDDPFSTYMKDLRLVLRGGD